MYDYYGNVIRVVDGDTLHIDIDLGTDVHNYLTVRLYGVNAPEHGTPEGDAATAYVENWVHNHAGADGRVMLTTIKDRKEKYGRYLGIVRGWNEGIAKSERAVTRMPDRELNLMLVEEGHAVPYSGGKR